MTLDLNRRHLSFGMLALLGGMSGCERAGPDAPPAATALTAADPLSAWNEGTAKERITEFVRLVSQPGPDFVPPENRIAVFDNDGTLWIEQPLYAEFMFAIDRAMQLIEADPTLASRPAFARLVSDGAAAAGSLSNAELAEIILATHTGGTQEDLARDVRQWAPVAHHPRFDRPYTQLVYEPQLQLLDHLRTNGFKVFIVSGGGVDFMRAWAPAVYGVPPEQIIGSSARSRFHEGDVIKTPEPGSIDDEAGKPENIQLHIGQIPILAVGNSDGDQEMLEYTASNSRPNLQVLIRHDDARREYAYDRNSKVGRLDVALEEARLRGWLIVSMQQDWRSIFPDADTAGA